MPFTVSHIAAVLPLRRSRLSFAALAIGSMSPDFSYILALYGPSLEAHTPIGLFTFCLPISLAIWWLYVNYLQSSWKNVFPWLQESRPNSFVIVVFSVLIGAATHLVWDSFTHRYGWPVEHLPILLQEISLGMGRPRRLYSILQHLSTVVGALLLLLSLGRYLKVSRTKFIGSWRYFFGISAATVLLSLALNYRSFAMGLSFFESSRFEANLVQFIFRVLAAMAVVLVAFPIVIAKRR